MQLQNYDDLLGHMWVCHIQRYKALPHTSSCSRRFGGFQHRRQWAAVKS